MRSWAERQRRRDHNFAAPFLLGCLSPLSARAGEKLLLSQKLRICNLAISGVRVCISRALNYIISSQLEKKLHGAKLTEASEWERSGSGEIINLAPSHFVAQKVAAPPKVVRIFPAQRFYHHLVSLLQPANFYISISSLSIKLLVNFFVSAVCGVPTAVFFYWVQLKLLEQQRAEREALIHRPTSQQ